MSGQKGAWQVPLLRKSRHRPPDHPRDAEEMDARVRTIDPRAAREGQVHDGADLRMAKGHQRKRADGLADPVWT